MGISFNSNLAQITFSAEGLKHRLLCNSMGFSMFTQIGDAKISVWKAFASDIDYASL
jgi:hypothetical protein